MDILTHTLSGIAVGTVAASFTKSGFKDKVKIIIISGIAGALPDLDAISLWSGFDKTIGSLFNLTLKGREIYSAKLWYSHHAFMHSIAAGMMLTVLVALLQYFIDVSINGFKNVKFSGSILNNKILLLGVLFSYLVHLFEDMPTPSSTWGGVNFFWPSKTYIGGTGGIWWWNNYDIFLIVISVILVNFLLIMIGKFSKLKISKITLIILLIGFAAVIYQVKTRSFDFSYKGHSKNYHEFEMKSKQIQKNILGMRIFLLMEKFDKKLKIYF